MDGSDLTRGLEREGDRLSPHSLFVVEGGCVYVCVSSLSLSVVGVTSVGDTPTIPILSLGFG